MKLVLQPAAQADILNQLLYLIDQGTTPASEQFVERVEETLERLLEMPRKGSPYHTHNKALRGLRHWPVRDFEMIWIYYRVIEDRLQVIRLLHTKRHTNQILRREK